MVLSDLTEFANFVTRVKVMLTTADNLALGETGRTCGRDFAAKHMLSRMWQMLFKGIAEVQSATQPRAVAETVLVRIAYIADLPTQAKPKNDRSARRRVIDARRGQQR